jgi:hypothetical protein
LQLQREWESTTSKVSRKIKEELAELFPPTLFFFVALHIVAFIHAPMNKHSESTSRPPHR